MIPLESRQFSLSNHSTQAFKVMNELRKQKELCDIVITIKKQEFHAHRIVLAGCSPYLKAMFTNGMLETDKSHVEIQDIEPLSMELLLDFMYTGCVDITTDNVQSIMQGASMLNLSGLRNACSQFLQLHIDASNCLGINSFADMYSCPELENTSKRYILQHFLEVITHDEYTKIAFNKLVEILQSDQLQVSSEEQVFKAALIWINNNLYNVSNNNNVSSTSENQVDIVEVSTSVTFKSVIDVRDSDDSSVEKNNQISSSKGIDSIKLFPQKTNLPEHSNTTIPLSASSKLICQIMQNIRLALLDINFLENEVLKLEFVRNCAICQNLVANAIRLKSDNSALALISTRSQPQGVFVVGGRNSTDCQLKSMERYDFLRDQWVPMGHMTVSRTAVGATTLNGLIYSIGGECAVAEPQDGTLYLSCTEVYDPVLKQWHRCADLNIARSFITVCSLGGHIYALGGEEKCQSLSIVERYCGKTDTWQFFPNMKRKRAGAGAAVCEGKIYVAGGYDKSSNADRASVECYDPETCEWSFVAEMEKARSGLALVSVDHYLYVLGGRGRHNDQYLDLVERYNTWTHQWTYLAPLSTPRSWPGAAVVDNKIYLMGGFDGNSRLRSVEMYDPELDTWTLICHMNVCRAGCGAAVL